MSLYHFHRVLIAAAILFDFFFTYWAVKRWQNTADNLLLLVAVGTSVVTVALIAYLVYFNRNLTLMHHIVAGRCGKCGANIRHALAQQQAHCPDCGVALSQPT